MTDQGSAVSAPAVTVPARLRPADLARLAAVGLRARKLRAGLSALGIAIGVAVIVAVLGLSASASAGLLAEIRALGTNLLTVQNGQNLGGGTAELPAAAPAMVGRLPGATQVQDTGAVGGASAYRSPLIPAVDTNALSVDAASLGLLPAVGTSLALGSWLNAATAREPAAAAASYLGFDGHPSTIYVRAADSQVKAVDNLLAAQADPENPEDVQVSQPSSALTAQADAQGAFNTLFLGLGAVALLVGAIGVANIMVISVLERRSEIGLRRALGATKGQIRIQFLAEAILLAAGGGAAGLIAGAAATALYARSRGWAIVIPPQAWAGGLAAALIIGALAGLLPALKAARLSPTQALWSL